MWAVGCIYAELLSLRPIFKGEEAKIDNKKNLPFQKDQMIRILEVLGSIDSTCSSPIHLSLSLRSRSTKRSVRVGSFADSFCLVLVCFNPAFVEDRWPTLGYYPDTPHLQRIERYVSALSILTTFYVFDANPFLSPTFPSNRRSTDLFSSLHSLSLSFLSPTPSHTPLDHHSKPLRISPLLFPSLLPHPSLFLR
jgi:hypothetical protein